MSPHCYFTKDFAPCNNDVFLDVGSAEAKEAVDLIGIPKKIYLFEGSKDYKNTLQKTFEKEIQDGYAQVITKFVSQKYSGADFIRLDDAVLPCENLFIKMDVEGNEIDVLDSAKELLTKSAHVRLSIACYHYKESANELFDYLTRLGFRCWYTHGFVIFNWEPCLFKSVFWNSKILSPYFRNGVIRAEK